MTVFIARHGETAYNRQRLMQGQQIDATLNATGLAQAEALAARFATVPLAAIYTSPLKRARQTAEAVGKHHPGVEIIELPELKEMSWGDLEGRSIDEVGPQLRSMGDRWAAGDFEGRLGGGETILEVRDRALGVLDVLSSRDDKGPVLVVTHGRYLRVLLAQADYGSDLRAMDSFPHSNTGVYQIRYDGARWNVDLKNCTDHLSAKAV